MKAIHLHINAIKVVAEQLRQGRFLIYFLPGLLVSFLFLSFFTMIREGENFFDFAEKIPLIGSYLGSFIKNTFGIIYFIVMQVYIFFVLTILSPFNTILSEKLDTQLTGKEYPFSFAQVMLDFFRMIGIVILALIMQFFFMGIVWLITWILGLQSLNTVLFTAISAFFIGFSFYDYSLERYKLGVFDSLGFSFKNLLSTTITGLIFLAIYSLPYVGVLLAPVLVTMIATIVYLQKEQHYTTL